MGMAVDANVLIYERIREEMAAGKLMKKAIQDGFSNAISAIIDSNVTTFLTGVVLAVFGTGPIRGFAVTLMIGIVSSFLTAVFISRLLLERYADSKKAKELPFTTVITKNWFRGLNINFIGKRFWGYAISGTIIIFSILGLIPGALQSELNFGIDFSGGRNYIIRFAEPVNTQDVKASLDEIFRAQLGENETYSLNVITIGAENQIRVSTNFGIHNDSEEFEDQIENLLYEGCKPFLADDVTPERFLSTQIDDTVGIMQSQKVGPSVADDIKTLQCGLSSSHYSSSHSISSCDSETSHSLSAPYWAWHTILSSFWVCMPYYGR